MDTFKIVFWIAVVLWGLCVGCNNNSSNELSDAVTPPPDGGTIPDTVDCGEPSGNIYYVSPSGNDNAAGTREEPWQTFAKATAFLEPGDGLYLMEGVYNEHLLPVTSGTADAPIIIASEPEAGEVEINGRGVDFEGEGLVEIAGVSFIRVCNLTVRGSSNHGVSVHHTWEEEVSNILVAGMTVLDSGNAAIHIYKSSDVVVENNFVKESITSGIGVWYSQRVGVRNNEVVNARNDDDLGHEEWISIAGVADFEVANNELYMTPDADFDGHSAIDVKESSYRGSVHHNYIHDFNKSGQIYLDAWEAGIDDPNTLSWVDVYSNLSVNAKGITVGSESGGIAENIRIFNNLIVDSYSSGILLSETGAGGSGNGPRRNIHIFNNTIYGTRNHGTSAIYITTSNVENILIQNNIAVLPDDMTVGMITAGREAAVDSITVSHNLVSGPTECSNDYPDCVELSGNDGNLNGNPLFEDAGNFDFHLTSNSPAIDQGIDIDDLNDDFDGNPRPSGAGFDIGAFEF